MGFTPLESLVMGTRSGDVDPSLIEHIALQEGMSLRETIMIARETVAVLAEHPAQD